MTQELFVGLMSGTSMDSIDAVLVNFADDKVELLASHSQNYPQDLKEQLETLIEKPTIHLDALGQLNIRIGKEFAQAVIQLLKDNKVCAEDVKAIGSHGQTIRHKIEGKFPFSMQIGDANVIAVETGITTVADFRSKDVALGGQGAPLVPAFHQAIFSDKEHDRAIVNIGGISNVTFLFSNGKVLGHDCGPGNTLMDLWAQKNIGMPFDQNGAWAKQGVMQETLLLQMLTDDYFKQPAPKSTGREYFNLDWLNNYLSGHEHVDAGDIQTTLCELSAQSIATDIINTAQEHTLYIDKIIVCGGGSRNSFLMHRLNEILPYDVINSDSVAYPSDWIEALAFAWFARNTLAHKTSSISSVTGSRKSSILGNIVYTD